METSVPCRFMLDIEYSIITSDVIKSFDCNCTVFDLIRAHASFYKHALIALCVVYMIRSFKLFSPSSCAISFAI